MLAAELSTQQTVDGQLSVYDFDYTLTTVSTMDSYERTSELAPLSVDHSTEATVTLHPVEDFRSFLKTSLNSVVTSWKSGMIAIASYHNNPDFIATVFATLVNKPLQLIERQMDPEQGFVLSAYEHDNKILCVSTGACDDGQYRQQLWDSVSQGKNRQLALILDYCESKGRVVHTLSFFDDQRNFCQKALTLTQTMAWSKNKRVTVKSFHVQPGNVFLADEEIGAAEVSSSNGLAAACNEGSFSKVSTPHGSGSEAQSSSPFCLSMSSSSLYQRRSRSQSEGYMLPTVKPKRGSL